MDSLETKLLYEMSPVGLVCKGFLNLNMVLFLRVF